MAQINKKSTYNTGFCIILLPHQSSRRFYRVLLSAYPQHTCIDLKWRSEYSEGLVFINSLALSHIFCSLLFHDFSRLPFQDFRGEDFGKHTL